MRARRACERSLNWIRLNPQLLYIFVSCPTKRSQESFGRVTLKMPSGAYTVPCVPNSQQFSSLLFHCIPNRGTRVLMFHHYHLDWFPDRPSRRTTILFFYQLMPTPLQHASIHVPYLCFYVTQPCRRHRHGSAPIIRYKSISTIYSNGWVSFF